MIPRAHITAWRPIAPWSSDAQVEQDLVLTRALVEIFSEPGMARALAFRGGTALHKLLFRSPQRYSEDIDLVQADPGPIGRVLGLLRSRLDPWLGEPKWKRSQSNVAVVYRFTSEIPPITPLRLKVEINTREHLRVLGLHKRPLIVDNPWFAGRADVVTYAAEELLGTKLRALYQRRKGRDLYDLAQALADVPDLDPARVVECFSEYMRHGGTPVSRAEFEANMALKLEDPAFREDVQPLLAIHSGSGRRPSFDPVEAYDKVHATFIARLPGEAWKGKP